MLKNRLSKIFINLQRQTTGGYDTFHTFKKSKGGKRLQHKRARRLMKFYDGFDDFINQQKTISRKREHYENPNN